MRTDREWENPRRHRSGAAVITVDEIPQVNSKASLHGSDKLNGRAKLRVFIEKFNSNLIFSRAEQGLQSVDKAVSILRSRRPGI